MDRGRTFKLYLVFLTVFCALLVHLYFIQIVNGKQYAILASRQGTESVALEDISRGDILDRNLLSLTGSTIMDFIVVFPKATVDREKVIAGLAAITGLETDIVKSYFDKGACYIPYPLTATQVEKINSHNWQGVMVYPVKLRYGTEPLANHLLGYVGYPDDASLLALASDSKKIYQKGDLTGVQGLEEQYEKELKGTRPVGSVSAHFDGAGNLIVGSSIVLENVSPDPDRQNLILTIDRYIQKEVERIMDDSVPSGAVVVMDTATGDIVAMASRPNFDPRLDAEKPTGTDGRLLDQCTTYYQPGSVFKIVVAAAAIEEGLVTPGTEFFCAGEEDELIPCWHREGHGMIDFAGAFANSCNPVFARVGLELGANRVIEYATKFGFGSSSIVGYETFGKGPGLSTIGEGYNLVNSSVGQWPVMATPVQVTAALNALVNDGVYIEPRLVKGLRYPGGGVARHFPMGGSRKIVSMETAREMCRLMEMVTTSEVGEKAYIELYGSAGKTGSAQTEGAEARIDAWFAGYAPLEKPKYVVTVLVKDGVSGGATAAPIFREIMENIM